MVGKDNDRTQLPVTDGVEWATGDLNVTEECVGFTVVNPTYAAAIALREIGERTYYNSLRVLLRRTHIDYD